MGIGCFRRFFMDFPPDNVYTPPAIGLYLLVLYREYAWSWWAYHCYRGFNAPSTYLFLKEESVFSFVFKHVDIKRG